jgi:hypothetical protein
MVTGNVNVSQIVGTCTTNPKRDPHVLLSDDDDDNHHRPPQICIKKQIQIDTRLWTGWWLWLVHRLTARYHAR